MLDRRHFLSMTILHPLFRERLEQLAFHHLSEEMNKAKRFYVLL